MHIYEYIPIDVVITRLPSMLKEEENNTILNKWALDCYLQNEKDHNNKFESRFCIIKIDNNVGSVPTGFKQLYEAQFFTSLPDNLDESHGQYIRETIDGRHVIIFQSILYNNIQNKGYNMRWAGQDASLVKNNCLNLLCDDCDINFTIDRKHSSITTSVEQGYVARIYKSTIVDEDNNFLIPNDKTLIDALAKYCIAQHYLNASMRRENGAYEMYKTFINESNLLFGEYQSRNLLRKFDKEDYVESMHTISNLGKLYQLNRRRWF